MEELRKIFRDGALPTGSVRPSFWLRLNAVGQFGPELLWFAPESEPRLRLVREITAPDGSPMQCSTFNPLRNMKSRNTMGLSILAGGLAFVGSANAVDLIVNGSFEDGQNVG